MKDIVPGKRNKKFVQPHDETEGYNLASEHMSVDSKLELLKELGREDMVDLFKEWKPRKSAAKRKGPPLDQRVNILITKGERSILDNELNHLRKIGEKITMSQFIRNKAISSVDLGEWKRRAEEALPMIEDIYSRQKDLKKEQKNIMMNIEEESEDGTADNEDISHYQLRLSEINDELKKIVSQPKKRTVRLSGRMTMPESETVKWRANRLCIPASDYLRFMIFNLYPNSSADDHFSYDSKRRFYISIIDVADNGWGDVPTIYNCSQCEKYVEEIERLEERIRQLTAFV